MSALPDTCLGPSPCDTADCSAVGADSHAVQLPLADQGVGTRSLIIPPTLAPADREGQLVPGWLHYFADHISNLADVAQIQCPNTNWPWRMSMIATHVG